MADSVQAHETVGGATARGKPDPHVQVPPAVKAAADRANELAAQAKAAKDAKPSEADAPLNPPSPSPPAPTPGSQSGGTVVANFDPKNPAPPQPPEPTNPADWEHQFRSLRGRYEREIENNRRMAQQLTDTQKLLAQVNVQPAPPPAELRFANSNQRRITDKERSEYGDELMDVVGRRAQEVTEPLLAQIINELQGVKRQIGGVQNAAYYDAQVGMYEALKQEVPNWDAINNSPEFARWLDQPDPIFGQTKRAALGAAHTANQTARVVEIFKRFLNDQLGVQPPSATPPANSNQPLDLAQYAAPGRAKPGQTEAPPEKPIFTAAQISQFYREKTAGKYAGREAEADALERALIAAGNEGRIRRP